MKYLKYAKNYLKFIFSWGPVFYLQETFLVATAGGGVTGS